MRNKLKDIINKTKVINKDSLKKLEHYDNMLEKEYEELVKRFSEASPEEREKMIGEVDENQYESKIIDKRIKTIRKHI